VEIGSLSGLLSLSKGCPLSEYPYSVGMSVGLSVSGSPSSSGVAGFTAGSFTTRSASCLPSSLKRVTWIFFFTLPSSSRRLDRHPQPPQSGVRILVGILPPFLGGMMASVQAT
jgi:hypothetical protein